MARTKITVNTVAYRRTHGRYPWNTQGQGKSLWTFRLDAQPHVIVKYGTYQPSQSLGHRRGAAHRGGAAVPPPPGR